MSTLVLRDVPDHLHARLKAQAQHNRRSLNKEAVLLIEQALSAPRAPVSLPPPVRVKGERLTIAQIEDAMTYGRD